MQTILKEKQEMKESIKELAKESTKEKSIALEARNEGKQIERKEKNIAHVKKLMIGLQMSFKEAVCLLEIPEKEIKEIEKYFQS